MCKKPITLLFLIFLPFILIGQTPISPNLTIGASKVLLQKGELDAQLIAEIIATKQDEVRTELAQRFILKNLRNSNIAVQNFAGESFELLFSKASSKTKKKELLKNAAELALVIGFSEYYLVDLNNRLNNALGSLSDYQVNMNQLNAKIDTVEVNFVLEYLRRLDQQTQIKFCQQFFKNFNFTTASFDNFKKLVAADSKSYAMINNSAAQSAFKQNFYNGLSLENRVYFSLSYYNIENVFDKVALKPRIKSKNNQSVSSFAAAIDGNSILAFSENSFLPKPINLQQFKNNYSSSKIVSTVGSSIEILQSRNLASENDKGGFTSPNHLLIGLVYQALSNNEKVRQFGFYQRKDDDNLKESIYQSKEGSIEEYFQPIEKIINDKANKLLKYYELIQRVNNELGDKQNLQNLYTNGKKYFNSLESIRDTVNAIIGHLKNVKVRAGDNLSSKEKDVIKNLIVNLPKIKLGEDEPKILNDYINYLQEDIFPFFTTLSIDHQGEFSKVVNSIESAKGMIEALGIFITVKNLFGEASFSKNRIKMKINQYMPYLELLKYLSNLDDAVTYDKIFKFIADLGEIFVDKKSGRVLNSIVNFMDKYAEIDSENNTVSFDLEGVTQDLYSQYQQNSRSRLSFSFTVGVNTATPWINKGNNKIALLQDSDGNNVSNASFVSEKLGIKYKVFDWNRKYVNGASSSKPVVNNLHIISYASGLLYQIDALNTEDKFDFTSLGVGVGVTFFNNLDFNISYGGQINDWFDRNYLNIGFDIQITEYLSALSKRRAQNQAKN